MIQLQQRTQNQNRIVIVDAFDVTFGISRRHKLLHSLQQSIVLFVRFRNCWHLNGSIFDRRQHQVRQILSSIDIAVFRDNRLIPDSFGGVEFLVCDGFKVVRPAQVEEHLSVFDYSRQIQRLRIDGEVVLAELNDVLTIDIQFVFITQLSNRVFTNGFQATLNVVNFDRLAHLGKLADNVAHFVDHQIRCKVAVDLVDRLKI